MKIKLRSDFVDYYDGCFEAEGVSYNRFRESGPSRREMYALLEKAGYRVPRHGIVEELAAHFKDGRRQATELVVYGAERGQGGDNHLVSLEEALSFFPNHYCTEYLRVQPSGLGWSLQYLQIGVRCWWLSCNSNNNWRSNAGDFNVEILLKSDGSKCYKCFASPSTLVIKQL